MNDFTRYYETLNKIKTKARDGVTPNDIIMKFKILRWLSSIDWVYKLSIALIANRIVHGQEYLTPQYLLSKGWIQEGDFFVEQNIKERDKIWIQFENHYFRIYHGAERTFIGLESKKEWFENYYLLAHGDNGRYQLAGI